MVGNTAGLGVQLLAVTLGLGAIVQQSIVVFTVLKIAGAAYLVYLGVQALRHRRSIAHAFASGTERLSTRRILREGFVVGVTNPKSIVLFTAILPQFVDRSLGHVPLQMMILGLDLPGHRPLERQHVGGGVGQRPGVARQAPGAPGGHRRHRRPDHDRARPAARPHRSQGLTPGRGGRAVPSRRPVGTAGLQGRGGPMSSSAEDDHAELPPVEMDALRVLYQAAGKLRLDPNRFPPPAFGLDEALHRVAGRSGRDGEPVNRRALYLSALGYLAGAAKRLPVSDDLVLAYRDYVASLAPPGVDGAEFRQLIGDDGSFDPVRAANEPDLLHDYQLSLRELINLYEGDVCNIALVAVGGQAAVAIYSELTTHKPIGDLDGWVNPKLWDTWGPALFKQMQVHEPPPEQAVAPPPGIEGFTATFLEHVDLFGHDLQNQLACAYSRGDEVVAMTYDLVESRDDEVTVDRGFVSATAIDDQRSRLRVLKIIGFSDPAAPGGDARVLPAVDGLHPVRRRERRGHRRTGTSPRRRRCSTSSAGCCATSGSTRCAPRRRRRTRSSRSICGSRRRRHGPRPAAVVASGRQLVHQVVQDWAKLWQSANATGRQLGGHCRCGAPATAERAPRAAPAGAGRAGPEHDGQLARGAVRAS